MPRTNATCPKLYPQLTFLAFNTYHLSGVQQSFSLSPFIIKPFINIMADVIKGSGGSVCNDRCGCPSPCPGGIACRCTSASGADDVVSDVEHRKCSCGEHCGCNPCTCSKSTDFPTTAAGKAFFCLCGDGCTCIRCSGAWESDLVLLSNLKHMYFSHFCFAPLVHQDVPPLDLRCLYKMYFSHYFLSTCCSFSEVWVYTFHSRLFCKNTLKVHDKQLTHGTNSHLVINKFLLGKLTITHWIIIIVVTKPSSNAATYQN